MTKENHIPARRGCPAFLQPCVSSRSRSGGFTLTEILVGIAIIAVLATLLITGLGMARISAAKAKSTSNLRQLATAAGLHAGANEGRLANFTDVTHFSAGTPDRGGRYTEDLHRFLGGGDGWYPEFIDSPKVFYHPLDEVYSESMFDSRSSARWSFHAYGLNRKGHEIEATDVLIRDRSEFKTRDPSEITKFRQNSAAAAQGGVLVLWGDFSVTFERPE